MKKFVKQIALCLTCSLMLGGCGNTAADGTSSEPSASRIPLAESDPGAEETDSAESAASMSSAAASKNSASNVASKSDSAAAASSKSSKADGKALKILMIGNSFSVNAMEYVWQIARDCGYEDIYLGNLIVGGCSLSMHWNLAKNDRDAYEYRTNSKGTWKITRSNKMDAVIRSEEWDFISLQQSSQGSGDINSYSPYLEDLISHVQKLAPKAKLVWHMTWADAKDADNSAFSFYKKDQDYMYKCITSIVQEKILANRVFAAVIPNGTAIQNARTSYIGDNFTQDGHHLSMGIGQYIAGLTLVKALTGADLEKVVFTPDDVGSAEKKVAIEAADNAVKSPYAVTASAYKKSPAAGR